jgi:acyl carrier protein
MESEQTLRPAVPGDFQALQEKIQSIFLKEADIDLTKIDMDKDIRQQVYIDSIQLAEVYAAINLELGVELPTSLLAATTLRQMMDILRGELKKAPAASDGLPVPAGVDKRNTVA